MAVGVPISWTADYPPTHRPSAVAAALEQARRTCPRFAAARSYVDCEEAPCMVWVQPDDALDGCSAWGYETRHVAFVGGLGSFAQGQWPMAAILDIAPRGWPDEEQLENVEKRWSFRRDFMADVVDEAWTAADSDDGWTTSRRAGFVPAQVGGYLKGWPPFAGEGGPSPASHGASGASGASWKLRRCTICDGPGLTLVDGLVPACRAGTSRGSGPTQGAGRLAVQGQERGAEPALQWRDTDGG